MRLLTAITGVVSFIGEVACFSVTSSSILLNLLDLLANSIKLAINSGGGLVQLHQEI